MSTQLVLHGHFYQPPRESPWTKTVDNEPSAAPFHDWNERIFSECYRANAFARVVDDFGRVLRIVNNYENISFNFGPTLLSWMEQHDRTTYQRILEADHRSVRANGGHGNAIAQGYNHAILPLCNERDRRTQIRWGLADFRARFGREAEAMWLPETAVSAATVAALIEEGLSYVILSPYQAERVQYPDGTERDVSDGSIDPGVAYLCHHPDGSGRTIAAFFYDGPIARAIAFDGALRSSQSLLHRLSHAKGGAGRLVNVATDGESYGHHTRHGDRTLAYALGVLAPSCGFRLTNYGAYLAEHPPVATVLLKPGPNGEGTAWSCAHGVGRWYRHCGCQDGGREGFSQAWRGHLRRALDLLRDETGRLFSATTGDLFTSPWAARDAYIEVLLDPQVRDQWLSRHAARPLTERERVRALTYLEMQHAALKMYTSCGFFFSDISGIETVQILKYAGKALDLIEELGQASPRDRFLEILSEAKSNYPEMGNGAAVVTQLVEPLRVPTSRIAAHLAIASLVAETEEVRSIAGHTFSRNEHRAERHGRVTLSTSRIRMEETATSERLDLATATIHLGGIDFYCVLKAYPGTQRFNATAARIWGSFRTASLPTLLRVMREELGPDEHGIESLLPEERQKIAGLVLGDLRDRFAEAHLHLYEANQRTLDMLHEAGIEPPIELSLAAELTLTRRFDQELLRVGESRDPKDFKRAIEVAKNAKGRGIRLDTSMASLLMTRMINEVTRELLAGSCEPLSVKRAFRLVDKLGAKPNLDRAQEIFEELRTKRPLTQEEQEIAELLGFATTSAPHSQTEPTGPSSRPAIPDGELREQV